eukprot:GEMP01006792.1.p1 GENE.GEMP01006792.1~~GEMP01006792.1.p1  ORF type:complete len:483 (+),score=80.92 GEMP01006792.1:388-1836(+)
MCRLHSSGTSEVRGLWASSGQFGNAGRSFWTPTDVIFTVGSKVYHPGCFKCHKCGKMSSSTTHDGTGFLCESCEPRCSACRKPLRGKFVKTDDMACHPECFRCAMCKEQLAEHFKSPQGFVCAKCSVMERQGVADAIDRRKNELNIRVRKEQALQYKLNWSKSEREESTCVLSQLGVANLGNDVGITLGADVRVAKVQHTAHVNMAYLATALSIFDVSDADPKFSLDPANQQKMSESEFQVKKFYPEFLENTPYGEVLFQADFVLKKLAFGEIAIPGLDLLSADSNSIDEMPFMGREWFVVREATVDVTQDGFLIPRVKMGVECREIVDSPDGIKDAPYTDANSRFVKHAKKVTEHFYEIAQHIPVIAELLEVAKATVLARYLVRKGAKVDKDVIRRISHPRVMRTYEKQIPTVIKHQHFSTVHNDEKGVVRTDRRIRTLHGGVDLTIPNKIGEVTTSSRKRVSLQSGRTESLPLFRASCGA